MGVVFHLNSSF